MAKGMKILTIAFLILFIVFFAWYILMPRPVLLSICITLGVFLYHFAMRLLVGYTINGIFHNKFNYNAWWFRERKHESKLYKLLRVKRLTRSIPTYSPDTFDIKKHSWEEIAMATCQAELVHEIIILLSFLPILLIIPFGTPVVFVLTSVGSALFDSIFVIVQRYNRPRLISHIEKLKKRANKKA